MTLSFDRIFHPDIFFYYRTHNLPANDLRNDHHFKPICNLVTDLPFIINYIIFIMKKLYLCHGKTSSSYWNWLNLTFLNFLASIFKFGRLFIGMIEVKQDTYMYRITQNLSNFSEH